MDTGRMSKDGDTFIVLISYLCSLVSIRGFKHTVLSPGILLDFRMEIPHVPSSPTIFTLVQSTELLEFQDIIAEFSEFSLKKKDI